MTEPNDNPFGPVASTLSQEIQKAHTLLPGPTNPPPTQPPGFLPPEQNNPFAGLAQDLSSRTQEDDDQRKKFIATRAAHSDWTQPQAQQALLLSAAHPDVDPSVIADHLDDFSKATTQDQLAASLRDHPRLAEWMDDPMKATAIKDDVANLGWLEWLITGKWEHVNSYTPTPQEIAYAKANGMDPQYRQVVPSIWGSSLGNAMDQQKIVKLSLADMRGLTSPEDKVELSSLRRKGTNRDFAGDDTSIPWLRRVISDTIGMGPYLAGSTASRLAGGFVGAGAAGLTTAELGPGAVAAASIGGAVGEHVGAQAWDFYQQVGPLYEDLLDLKHEDGSPVLTPDEAKNYALWTTLGTSTITAGFGHVVARALPGIGGLLTDVTKRGMSKALAEETGGKILQRSLLQYGQTVGSMGIMMGAQSGATAAAEEIAKSKHGEVGTWARVGGAAADGFKKGAESALLIAAWEPGRMMLHDSANLMKMRMDIMRLKAITDAAQNSSVLKTKPELGEQVVNHLAGGGLKSYATDDGASVKEFYIDPQGFDEVFAQQGLDGRKAWQQTFGETASYDQAKVDGAPIAVPADKFITKLATTRNAQDFFQITKLAPDGITLHAAKQADSLQQLRIKEIDQEISSTGIDPYKSIQDDFYQSAIAAGIPEKLAKDEAKVTAQRVKGWVAYYPKDMPENDPFLWYTRIFSNLGMKSGKGPSNKIKVGSTFDQVSDQAAFHGSPHDFDRFKMAHIGTGEGAQVFGHGLYFGEKEGTARYYRNMLTDSGPSVQLPDAWRVDDDSARVAHLALQDTASSDHLANFPPDKASLIHRTRQELHADAFDLDQIADTKGWDGMSAWPEDIQDREISSTRKEAQVKRQAADLLGTLSPEDLNVHYPEKVGKLYEVTIPEKSQLLSWEDNLAEQPEVIQDAVRRVISKLPGEEIDEERLGRMSGKTIYHLIGLRLSEDKPDGLVRNDKAASEALKAEGVPGLKYLDAGSRDASEKSTHNFVIWDEDKIQLTRKFDQAKGDNILRGQLFTNKTTPGDPVHALLKIYQAADESTFTHEMTHFWFETMASFSEEASAPPEMKKDFATLMDFAGYKDSADRAAHPSPAAEEKITYAWEKYLGEGKSPVPELASVFRHFKLWMLKIYGQVGPGSNYEKIYGQPLEISNEVRRVFDRLLGAHTATEEAAKQTGLTAIEKLIQFMSPAEQRFYRTSVENLKEESEQELVRRMQEEDVKENKAWFKNEYKEQRDAAQKALAKRPEYRALSILQDGTTPGGKQPPEALRGIKLDPDAVRDVLGTDDLSAYPRGIWEKGGKSPDEVAYMLGFDGGDKLLAGLKSTAQDGSFAKAVGIRAKARMTARYGAGLLDDPQRFGDAAIESINNLQQVRKIMLEMRAIRKQLAPDAAPAPATVSPEQLQLTAEHILSTKRLGDLDGSRYMTAQRSAAMRAVEAISKGDFSKAYAEKEYELLSGFLYKAANKFKAEAEKVQAVMTRSVTDGIRKRLGLADPIIRNISDAVLEATNTRDFQRGDQANKAALQAWEGYVAANSLETPYNEQQLQETIGNSKPLRQMTLKEAKDTANALISIQHYGKTLHEIQSRDARVNLDTAVRQITQEMIKGLPFLGKEPAAKTQVGVWDTVTRRLQAFDGAALEPETLFGWMGKSANEYIWNRYIDSRNSHDDMARHITDWFHKQWGELPSELQKARYGVIPDFDKLLPIPDNVNLAGARDHTTLWMLALNMGNESNKQRMLDGFGWTEKNVMDLLNKHMTKPEWDWVQSVWDLANKELWPKIAAKGERTTGVPPEKIQASKVITPHGEYEGGYFPARYEPRASALGAQQVPDVAKTNTTIGRMGTIKTYTKERSTSYSDIVSLQWSEVPNHISQVIYDLAFDEYTRDMNRLLSNQTMQDTMYQRLGSQRSLQVNDWLGVVASGAPNGVARGVRELANGVLGGLRSRAVLSSIGWSTSVMLSETSHFLTTIASGTVKASFGAPALAEMMFKYGSMRDAAMTMSKELPHRADSVTFQLRQELSEVGERGPQGPISNAYHAVRDTAFFFIQHLDNAISTWTWTSAYRQGLSEGMDSAAASVNADAAVRKTLPTHSVAEQSALLREKSTIGSLFMFYGYFNKMYNLSRTIVHDPAMAWIDAETPGEKLGAAGKSAVAAGRVMAMLFMATGVGELMSGRGREEDETWGQWAARKAIAAPFSIIPLVGTVADQAAGVAITGKRKEISLRQAPALAWADDMLKSLGEMTDNKTQGDEKAWEMLKVILSTVGLPGGRQISRTGQYLTSGNASRDMNAGNAGNLVSGLIYGQRKKQPATVPTMLQNLADGRTP